MTTVNKNFMQQAKQFGGVPFGNMAIREFHFETSSAGVALDSDLATAVQSGDVIRIGILPAGFRITDALIVRSDAFTASTTASIGFQYVDGVDVDAPYAQDAAYIVSALATDATGVTRKTGVKAPITLPKDVYVILTIGGAAHASVGVMDIEIIGIDTGSGTV